MSNSVGYLLGLRIPDRAQPDRACHPAAEYDLFARRNSVELTDYNSLNPNAPFTKVAIQRNLLHVALAGHGLSRKFERLIVSGEDVGLPLLFLERLRVNHTPTFIVTHGSYFRSPRFQGLMKLFRGMRHVHYLTLSETLRKTMVEKFGIHEANAHNCAYGVDTDFFDPSDLEDSTNNDLPIIASAGAANRDYTTLVEAARGLDAEVKIAADSTWFPTALKMPEGEMPTNVEARSYGNYSNLRGLYARANFIVVPLHQAEHACGYAVIAEAMAMGKAVIVSRTTRPSDFVREGETGFLVEPGNPAELRDRITHLLNHPDEATRMGKAARDMMARDYSLEAYCKRLESVIYNSRG